MHRPSAIPGPRARLKHVFARAFRIHFPDAMIQQFVVCFSVVCLLFSLLFVVSFNRSTKSRETYEIRSQ